MGGASHKGPETDAGAAPGHMPPGSGLPRIPGYEIQEELGRGATSTVYRVIRDDQVFALKLMNTRGERAVEGALRFRREGAAMARLKHPGLVRIFEVSESQSVPFLVMEL